MTLGQQTLVFSAFISFIGLGILWHWWRIRERPIRMVRVEPVAGSDVYREFGENGRWIPPNANVIKIENTEDAFKALDAAIKGKFILYCVSDNVDKNAIELLEEYI